MAKAGSLYIEIAADVAKLRTDMEKATSIVEGSFGKMETMAKSAAGIVAGYFAFTTIADSAKKTLELADNLNKMSQKVGMSADSLYSMQAAAKLADVDMQGLQTSLIKFNKNLGEAQMGTGEAENAMKNLGISFRDSSGAFKANDELLKEVSDKFADMPDGIAKTTLATKLFGKSGAELIPMLNAGSKSLAEFKGFIDAETAQAAERFNDSLTRMGIKSESFRLQILGRTVPALDTLSETLENIGKDSSFADGISAGLMVITEMAMKAGGSVAGLYRFMGAGWEMVKGNIPQAKAEFAATVDFMNNIDKRVDEMYKKANDNAKKRELTKITGYVPPSDKKQTGSAPELVDYKAQEKNAEEAAKTLRDVLFSFHEKELKDQQKLNEITIKAYEKYYQTIGDYAALWAMKEGEIRTQLVDLESAQIEAVVEKEKAAFDKSVANDEKRLESMKTYAEGVEFYINKSIENTQNQAQIANSLMGSITGAMTSGFEQFFDVTSSKFLDFKNLATSILEDIYKAMVRAMIINPMVNAATGAMGSYFGISVAGARANGGMVSSGSSYLVGERGAEIFTPSGNGTITSTSKLNGLSSSSNMRVEIINQSGQQLQISKAQTKDGSGEMIMQVILDSVSRNVNGARDNLRGMLA